MRRTTLILIIILAVIIIGGGAYLWLMRDSIELPWASNNNTTTNTVTNSTTTNTTVTNTAPTTITLPTEIKGDTALIGTLNVGSVKVNISSQQKQTTADGQTAEKGQTFLLVYFDAVEPANITAVDQGIRAAKVVSGKTSYPLLALKVASTYVKGDRGYLRFAIPEKATGLELQLGSGASLQTVTLK